MKGGEFCVSMVKNVMCSINAIIVIIGLGLIGYLSYVISVTKGITPIVQDGYVSSTVILLVVAIFGTLTFIIGCCGIKHKQPCLTMTFAVIMGILLVIQLIVGISGYLLRDKAEIIFEKTMEDSFMKYNSSAENRDLWNHIQKDFHCCGINGSKDYEEKLKIEVPQSCCADDKCDTADISKLYPKNCTVAVKTIVGENMVTAAKFAIVMAVINLIWCIGACCLSVAFRRQSSYESV